MPRHDSEGKREHGVLVRRKGTERARGEADHSRDQMEGGRSILPTGHCSLRELLERGRRSCKIGARRVSCGGANCCADGRSAAAGGSAGRRSRRWQMWSRTARRRGGSDPSDLPPWCATGRTRDCPGEMVPLRRLQNSWRSWRLWCSRDRRRQRLYLFVYCCVASLWRGCVSCEVERKECDSQGKNPANNNAVCGNGQVSKPAGVGNAAQQGQSDRKESPVVEQREDDEVSNLRHW